MKVRTIAARGLLLTGIWLLLTVFGVAVPSALAHNELTASNPENGSVMAAAPRQLELDFAQEIDAKFASVAVTAGATDLTVELAVQGKKVSVLLGDLPTQVSEVTDPAVWKLGYRMISTDGHPVSGLIQFTVDPAAPGAVVPTEVTPSSTPHSATGQSLAPSTEAAVLPTAAEGSDGGIGTWGWTAIAALAVIAVAVPLFLRRRRPAPTPQRPAARTKGRSRA